MLIIISGPSGSGKTTIVQEMLVRFPELGFSVSATTRSQRPGEEEGRDYIFLTKEEFRREIGNGALVEWEEIFGNYYGTMSVTIEHALEEGKHLLFDVDVKGALSVRRKFPDDAVSIFILPPDIDVLRQRLLCRDTDPTEIIEQRLSRAEMEIAAASSFDHVVVNDEISRAFDRVEAIIIAVLRQRTPRT